MGESRNSMKAWAWVELCSTLEYIKKLRAATQLLSKTNIASCDFLV